MYESGENYLETILILKQRNGVVRSIDIARELEFSKPSVSRAVNLLKEDGMIVIEGSGEIQLTEMGMDTAKAIYERHRILTSFLMNTAKVPEAAAEKDACKMEHIISEQVFEGIKHFLKEAGDVK